MKAIPPLLPATLLSALLVPVVAAAQDNGAPLAGNCGGDACEAVRLVTGEEPGCYYAHNGGDRLASIEVPPLEPGSAPQFLAAGQTARMRGQGGCLRIDAAAALDYVARFQKVAPDDGAAVIERSYKDPATGETRVVTERRKSMTEHIQEISGMWRNLHPTVDRGGCDARSEHDKEIDKFRFHIFRQEQLHLRNQLTLFERDRRIALFEAEIAKLEAVAADSPTRTKPACAVQAEKARQQDAAKRAARAETDERAAKTGKPDEAADEAPQEEKQAAVAEGPSEEEIHAAMVRIGDDFSAGNFEAAISGADWVLRYRPDHERTIYARGRAYAELGRHKEAIADFSAILERNPNSADAAEGRAMSYYRGKDYARAIADWNMMIELEPANWFGYFGRALASYGAGDFAAARADYDGALERIPKEHASVVTILSQRGASSYQLKDYRAAIGDATAAIAINPGNPWLYFIRGSSHAHLGELDAGMADAEEALRIRPNYALARQLRDAIGTARARRN